MDILALILIWPLVFFATGLALIAFFDLFSSGFGLLLLFLMIFITTSAFKGKKSEKTPGKQLSVLEQLEITRRTFLIFSISLLFPIFIRYSVEAFDKSLMIIILGLVVGFALTVWGMFIKRNQIILYSNIIGGTLTIVYLYTQLWGLGELARIIATGFGLFVAVAVSIIKLKDKLA